jgi:hypothetical protein
MVFVGKRKYKAEFSTYSNMFYRYQVDICREDQGILYPTYWKPYKQGIKIK